MHLNLKVFVDKFYKFLKFFIEDFKLSDLYNLFNGIDNKSIEIDKYLYELVHKYKDDLDSINTDDFFDLINNNEFKSDNSNKFLNEFSEFINLYGYRTVGFDLKDSIWIEDPQIVTPRLRLGTNKNVQIHLSFGATEAKPPEDVDAIMDVTETGTTLKQNQLKIVDTVMESSAHLIANKKSLKDKQKRQKIFDIVTLMRGAVQGRKYLHIYMNVKEKNLKKLLTEITSLKRPTVSPLSEKGWYGVNTVIPKSEFHKLVPKLRKLAQGLVVHEPRQIQELEEIKRDEEN